jgi:EamA-like transporter family
MPGLLLTPAVLASKIGQSHDGRTPPTSPLPAVLSLLGATTLTGANVAFGKAIVAVVPVCIFLLFRFAVATAALAFMVGKEQGPRLAHISLGQRRDLLLMALIGMVGFTVLMFEGLKRTAAADAGIITATMPAVVAALGTACAGESRSCAARRRRHHGCRARARCKCGGRDGRAMRWSAAPCCTRPCSSCLANALRLPSGRCGLRSAPISPG